MRLILGINAAFSSVSAYQGYIKVYCWPTLLAGPQLRFNPSWPIFTIVEDQYLADKAKQGYGGQQKLVLCFVKPNKCCRQRPAACNGKTYCKKVAPQNLIHCIFEIYCILVIFGAYVRSFQVLDVAHHVLRWWQRMSPMWHFKRRKNSSNSCSSCNRQAEELFHNLQKSTNCRTIGKKTTVSHCDWSSAADLWTSVWSY